MAWRGAARQAWHEEGWVRGVKYAVYPQPSGKPRGTKVSKTRRARVMERDGQACVKCQATEDLTIDHIHPRILGGRNNEDNLRILCRPCNSRKGGRVEVQREGD